MLNLKPLKEASKLIVLTFFCVLLTGSVFPNCWEGFGRGEIVVICLGKGGCGNLGVVLIFPFTSPLSLPSLPCYHQYFFLYFPVKFRGEDQELVSVSVLLILVFSIPRNPRMVLIFMKKGKSERQGSVILFTTL